MRTIVGVDSDELYVPALKLLGRLQFVDNQATLVHVDANPGIQFSPATIVYAAYDTAELEATMRKAGEELLREAAIEAVEAGLGEGLETEYAVGSSSAQLMEIADRTRGDLVVVGSGRHGPVGSFFLGSVGRALAVRGGQSFLVGRNLTGNSGKLSAVFATDFSDYAESCFRRLLQMKPEGLGHVTIVTATDPGMESKLAREAGLYGSSTNPLTEIETRMRECGERMVARLKEEWIEAEFRMTEGHPSEVVRQTMEETESDLLILGARGHGLIERVFIGSLALHQVVAESYAVLVLRMPEND